MNEKELILACIAGERKCQQQLFEMYAGKMMTVCRRYGRHRLESEDIMQEGFIKMFSNLEKFQFEGSFEGWLRKIMVNTALKKVARKSFKNEQLGLEDRHDSPVEASVYDQLSVEELMSLVNELPQGYKMVFNLYVIEGYSHREIGEQLNIEESSSRSQLVKARRLLQNKIIANQKIAV